MTTHNIKNGERMVGIQGGNTNYLAGIRLIEDARMVDRFQVRFPRTKKARIKKKFRKDKRNYRTVPKKEILHSKINNTMTCHPSVAAELRRYYNETKN